MPFKDSKRIYILKNYFFFKMFPFERKTPKGQKADSTPYTLYDPNKDDIYEWNDTIKVISIDPGIQNYCIRVEERPFKKGIIKPIITHLYDKLKLKKVDVGLENNNKCNHYQLLTNYLDTHLELFKQCNLVIIERQMPFNYKATRIAQHTITYFMTLLRNLQQHIIIIEVDSKLKGKELGAHPHMRDMDIKQWAIQEANRLLTLRNDVFSLNKIKKERKKDDLCDTVCQIEAFFKHMKWPLTEECVNDSIILQKKRPKIIIQN